MRIGAVYLNSNVTRANTSFHFNEREDYSRLQYVKNDIFMKSTVQVLKKPYITISFGGYPVHIVDGGNHATNMQHFANAISNNMDIEMYDVEVNPQDANMKQLKSLELELKILNAEHPKFKNNEYVAVPALASVPLLNLQEQYNRIMHTNKIFTPENLKANKKNLLKFLKTIYENPNKYRQYIQYMDSKTQGIEYAYGVIKEINKAKANGAKIYIPSGHPQDTTLKWLAGQRGLKPELYNYIATGIDKDGKIKKLTQEIKNNNWYDFNLLSLSNANVVGVKGTTGAQDYMFAAYDSCVTDGARGVYNFSPIRENGKLIGYSYTNTNTNEYPYEEFPANSEISNIAEFVGKDIDEVIASPKDINIFNELAHDNKDFDKIPNKLYPIEDVFSFQEIKNRKLRLQGDYVDKSLTLFFRKNEDGKVIFPKCDCEGSGKPSVLSMWGSCFSVMNAIARDIEIQNSQYPNTNGNCSNSEFANHRKKINKILEKGINTPNDKEAERSFNYAIALNKAFEASNNVELLDFKPYQLLGNLHFTHKKYDYANACYNNAINMLAKKIQNQTGNRPISQMLEDYENYKNSISDNEVYNILMSKYKTYSVWKKFVTSPPQKPLYYNDYKDKFEKGYLDYKNLILPCAKMFERLNIICYKNQEFYPAEVCKQASKDIKECNSRAEQVLQLRADGISYIGDLYNEIKREDY